MKTHGIPVLIHDSLNYQETFTRLQIKFPKQNFIDIRPRLNTTFNKLQTRQQQNFISLYGNIPTTTTTKLTKYIGHNCHNCNEPLTILDQETITIEETKLTSYTCPKCNTIHTDLTPNRNSITVTKRSTLRAKRSVKNKTLRSTNWYYLFNFKHIAIITPYEATITTTDSGNTSINKPRLDKQYSSLIYSVINGPQNPNTNIAETLTLIESDTFTRTKVTRNTESIDQVLTDLTSQLLTDPIPDYITEPDNIPDELQDLAQLYDIDIPTRNLILYSTHQSPYKDPNGQPVTYQDGYVIKNTYTNMYPRQYTTEDQLNELRDLINLYADYGIITPEKTQQLREQRELQRNYLESLNQQLDNLK